MSDWYGIIKGNIIVTIYRSTRKKKSFGTNNIKKMTYRKVIC